MANTRSAAKQARSSVRKRTRNRITKENLKRLEKEYRKLVDDKNLEGAKTLLPKVTSAYAKAAKTQKVHKNKASRKASRLSKLVAAPAAA